MQNCAAWLVTRTRGSEHITPVLRRLHWLSVRQRITYKILLLTYKALNGMAPKYIADLLQPYTPTRQLRSSKNLLVTPKSNLKFYSDRSFQVAAPRLWNSLTDDIRSIQNLDVFKNKIKTLLFRLRLLLVSWLPFFLLLYIFSLVNLSKSNVSYFVEISFFNCYILPLITQIYFFIF